MRGGHLGNFGLGMKVTGELWLGFITMFGYHPLVLFYYQPDHYRPHDPVGFRPGLGSGSDCYDAWIAGEALHEALW